MQGVDAQAKDGSIFTAFARANERPVIPGDRTLTEAELRYDSASLTFTNADGL